MADSREQERFEELVAGVEQIVARLQAGAVPLHEALTLYEEGYALLRKAQTQLDAAHVKLEQLKKDGEATP